MSQGFDAGSVQIRLRHDGQKVIAAETACQRPHLARALLGKQADEAAALVPLVYALCGRAQGAAARLAVAAARGVESAPQLDPMIEREVIREHLWRWLLDLPGLLGMTPLRDQFSALARAPDAGRPEALSIALVAPEVLALSTRIATLEQPILAAAPRLKVASASESLLTWPRLTERFCRLPTLNGGATETGAYARIGNAFSSPAGAFAVRWLARLNELQIWATGGSKVGAGGTASATPVAPGIGRALVETARGLLMHEVVLEGDRIADYRIVAPTEWNFHPDGSLSGWLIGRQCVDEVALREFVAHAVAALDPCVRWELLFDLPVGQQ